MAIKNAFKREVKRFGDLGNWHKRSVIRRDLCGGNYGFWSYLFGR